MENEVSMFKKGFMVMIMVMVHNTTANAFNRTAAKRLRH